MVKKLIIGSIFAALLMVLLPATSAVESNLVEENIATQYIAEELNISIEELKDKLDNPESPTFILVTLLIFLLRILQVSLVAFWGFIGLIVIIIRNLGNKTAI
jgi:hypothetical protein